ncbi:cytochrome P450 monooxygenase pc-5, partial [Mycena maculata]
CIGQEFAPNLAGFFFVKLLQRFQSFRLAPNFWHCLHSGTPGRQGVEKIFHAVHLMLHSKGGLWV